MYITSKHICFYAYLPKKAVSYLEHQSSVMVINMMRSMRLSSLDISPKVANATQATQGFGSDLRVMF